MIRSAQGSHSASSIGGVKPREYRSMFHGRVGRLVFDLARTPGLYALLAMLIGIGTVGHAQSSPQPTVKPPVTVGGLAGSGNGGGAGGGAGGGGGGGGGAGAGGAGSGSPGSEGGPGPVGPYHVVKVMNMGGETVDGIVCSSVRPFVIQMHTDRIDFNIAFSPTDATHGNWSYAYGWPDLGETHNATGVYQISPPKPDGTRSLTVDGKDQVVFTGFNGPMPMHYVFGLAPMAEPFCGP
jgi:hypothetical protein